MGLLKDKSDHVVPLLKTFYLPVSQSTCQILPVPGRLSIICSSQISVSVSNLNFYFLPLSLCCSHTDFLTIPKHSRHMSVLAVDSIWDAFPSDALTARSFHSFSSLLRSHFLSNTFLGQPQILLIPSPATLQNLTSLL